MANSVAGVHEVSQAIGGVPPTAPLARRPLPVLRDLPTRALRSHLQRLPEAAPIFVEEPLIETDTAPGFSALRQGSVGRGPIAEMTVDPDSGRLYVVNHADDSVCALDPATLTTVATVVGIEEPFAVAVADGRTYVSSVTMSYDAIVELDPSADEPAIHRVASSVRAFVASPSGRHLYIARNGRDGADVAVLDTADGRVSTVELRTRPGAIAQSIAVSRDGARVYVATTDHLGSELVVIGTDGRGATRVLTGLAFDATVRDIAVHPDGNTVFVATGGMSHGSLVHVIDARSLGVLDTMDFACAVTQLLVSAAGERLYALNGDRITVACTATHEIVDTITVVSAPSCIAESADGKKLYIADFEGGITALTVASSTASLLAKMMSADVSNASEVIDVSMLELEAAAV